MADQNSQTIDRYSLTPKRTDDSFKPGVWRYQIWMPPNIDMTDYDNYLVKETDNGRLDRIAAQYYQDSSLWWVIAWVNNIKDAMADLVPGTILKIPKKDAIVVAFSSVRS